MPSCVHTRIDARALREQYADFLDPRGAKRRILLTGHSHQAWPAVARQGLIEAYEVAARDVDDKWDAVFAAQDELRAHLARRLGGQPKEYAFAQNTHELVTRWLSALPWGERKKIVTTDGEFHAAFRQLRRLAELSEVEVVFVASEPARTLSERLCEAIDERTAGVLFSCVLFGTSSVVPGIDAVIARASECGASVMVDGYHAFDVVDVRAPEGAFFVAGGYKYAQWGEGTCFARVPSGCELRPVLTGWFAGFASLADRRTEGPVAFERDGAWRFAGSTFDPASYFRARAVARFFDEQGLTVERLRANSLAQTSLIIERCAKLKGLELATPSEPSLRGGFVSLRTARAAELVKALRDEGVFTDSRGELLRLGAAPYVTDDEIETAIEVLGRLSA
jgi:selenocysteine lyase/cysteine desulfurase